MIVASSESSSLDRLLEADDGSQAGPSSASYDRPKVPITLLTGYLGAGKSTLLEWVEQLNWTAKHPDHLDTS